MAKHRYLMTRDESMLQPVTTLFYIAISAMSVTISFLFDTMSWWYELHDAWM